MGKEYYKKEESESEEIRTAWRIGKGSEQHDFLRIVRGSVSVELISRKKRGRR